MAEVIVRQQGCVANRVAYPRAVDAFHQALQMLSERSPSPAGPGFSLDLAGGSVTVPVRTGITVQRTERRTWIVASIDDEHHEISAVECATRHEAQQFAVRMARTLVAERIRAQFVGLTGRAIGRAHLARLARQADAIAQAQGSRQAPDVAGDAASAEGAAAATRGART